MNTNPYGYDGYDNDPYRTTPGAQPPGPGAQPGTPGPHHAAPGPHQASQQSYPLQHGGAQPGYGPPPTDTSGHAIVSLVLGILSLVFLGGGLAILAPVGLVFAVLALRDTRDGAKSGRGIAIAGLVTSIIGSLLLLLGVLAVVLYIGLVALGELGA
ncbi:MAG: DUF4190 domain-containing protein [Brachybacterium sp.]|nr:DUF4190 domain-containing protein [Brachybacterium sp.]